jgi:HK97 gp10 family phage protein
MSFRSYRRNVMEEIERAEQRALTKIGMHIQGAATSRSPVGQYTNGQVGGALKGSWDFEVNEKSVSVGSNLYYAPFVEFGTGRSGSGSGAEPPSDYTYGGKNGMRAQRVLTGSVEDSIEEIKAIAARELNGVGD